MDIVRVSSSVLCCRVCVPMSPPPQSTRMLPHATRRSLQLPLCGHTRLPPHSPYLTPGGHDFSPHLCNSGTLAVFRTWTYARCDLLRLAFSTQHRAVGPCQGSLHPWLLLLSPTASRVLRSLIRCVSSTVSLKTLWPMIVWNHVVKFLRI